MDSPRKNYLKQLFKPDDDRQLVDMRIWDYAKYFRFNGWDELAWPDVAWNRIAADPRFSNRFTPDECRDQFALIMMKHKREEWLCENILPRDGAWSLFRKMQYYKNCIEFHKENDDGYFI